MTSFSRVASALKLGKPRIPKASTIRLYNSAELSRPLAKASTTKNVVKAFDLLLYNILGLSNALLECFATPPNPHHPSTLESGVGHSPVSNAAQADAGARGSPPCETARFRAAPPHLAVAQFGDCETST